MTLVNHKMIFNLIIVIAMLISNPLTVHQDPAGAGDPEAGAARAGGAGGAAAAGGGPQLHRQVLHGAQEGPPGRRRGGNRQGG